MNERHVTYLSRQKELCGIFSAEKAEAFLVTHLSHVRYLTGFSGSTALLILFNDGQIVFFTDFRYEEQVRLELMPSIEVRIVAGDYWDTLAQSLSQRQVSRLGFQPKSLTCHQFSEIKKKNSRMELIGIPDACERIIGIKSAWECRAIAEAARISDELFQRFPGWFVGNPCEQALAARLEYEGRLWGSESPAFPSIVASGANAALPHAQATSRRPQKGDAIIFDFGQKVQGYCSDLTRTLSLGKADAKLREIYAIVLEAQEAALRLVKAGVACSELDATARFKIEKSGFGKQFGHGLGHGVGLEVHEGPKISSVSKEVLRPGMMITIEPGIYIPGWGGVRIEDLVLVTEGGHQNLVHADKRLLELEIA